MSSDVEFQLPSATLAPLKMGRVDRLWSRLLRISAHEVGFERRGFSWQDPTARAQLERAGAAFVQGYNLALCSGSIDQLATSLDVGDRSHQGFSYEGAAMALGLRDGLSLGRPHRVQEFLDGPGQRHVYTIHVGIGWAVARFGRVARVVATLDPLLRWLVLDGYGFHEGFFSWSRYSNGRGRRWREPYSSRAFDQGLGRSLWFVFGADVERIDAAIVSLQRGRAQDLWSGVGLAAAYAGGTTAAALETLRSCALRRGALAQLRQGVAFAAKARLKAGIVAPHTEQACQVLCDASVEGCAHVTDLALENLAATRTLPAYEIWRRRIADAWSEAGEAA